MSDSLRPYESQHARPPCPSSTPRVHSNSRPSSQWCHPAISSSVVPASESFPKSQLFAWGGQSTGVSALASFLPKNTQGWSPSEWTGWISLQSKGLSKVFCVLKSRRKIAMCNELRGELGRWDWRSNQGENQLANIDQKKWKCWSLSRVRLFETPWTVAREAPLSMGFSRQEYRNGLPFPPPGYLPDPGIEPVSPMCCIEGRYFIYWAGLSQLKFFQLKIGKEFSSAYTKKSRSQSENCKVSAQCNEFIYIIQEYNRQNF